MHHLLNGAPTRWCLRSRLVVHVRREGCGFHRSLAMKLRATFSPSVLPPMNSAKTDFGRIRTERGQPTSWCSVGCAKQQRPVRIVNRARAAGPCRSWCGRVFPSLSQAASYTRTSCCATLELGAGKGRREGSGGKTARSAWASRPIEEVCRHSDCVPVCAKYSPGALFPSASFGAPADPLLRDAKNGDAQSAAASSRAASSSSERLFFASLCLPAKGHSPTSFRRERRSGRAGGEASEPSGRTAGVRLVLEDCRSKGTAAGFRLVGRHCNGRDEGAHHRGLSPW